MICLVKDLFFSLISFPILPSFPLSFSPFFPLSLFPSLPPLLSLSLHPLLHSSLILTDTQPDAVSISTSKADQVGNKLSGVAPPPALQENNIHQKRRLFPDRPCAEEEHRPAPWGGDAAQAGPAAPWLGPGPRALHQLPWALALRAEHRGCHSLTHPTHGLA